MQCRDDVGRHPRWCKGRDPLRGADAGESDLGQRGDVRMLRQPLRCRHRERAHAACFHHPDRVGDVEPRHLDIAVGEIAEDLGAAALEGNVDEIETRALGEDFGIDLLVAADAGAAVTDLAGVVAGIGEKVGKRLRRKVRRRREKEDRDVRQRGNDLHVALVIDFHFLREQDRRQRIGRDVADHEGVAVRPRAGHLLDRDDAGGARLVLHERVPAEALAQLFGIKTRNHVGQTAGRVRDDDADRLRWIGLRPRPSCEDGEGTSVDHGPPKAAHFARPPPALSERACRRILWTP